MSGDEPARGASGPRGGKSYGLCKKCGNNFKLKRHAKHRASKILEGVICPACGSPKKPEMNTIIKSLGKLTLIQALKSTGYVCLMVFAINILISLLVNGTYIGKLGSNLITNIISWLWFGLFAIFESRKLETLRPDGSLT